MPSRPIDYAVDPSQNVIEATTTNTQAIRGPLLLASRDGSLSVQSLKPGGKIRSDQVPLASRRNGGMGWTEALGAGLIVATGTTYAPTVFIDSSNNYRSALTTAPCDLRGPDGTTARYRSGAQVWSNTVSLIVWQAGIASGLLTLEAP